MNYFKFWNNLGFQTAMTIDNRRQMEQ